LAARKKALLNSPNFYGYARVSTDEQAERGVSLLDQRAKIRDFAIANGLGLHEVVEDRGECSKSLDRPGLKLVLTGLRSGLASGIVVTHTDRLTRHVGDMVRLVEEFFLDPDPRGCHLHSTSEHVETRTASGRLQLYIMTAVSQFSREKIVENTASAMHGKMSRSERTGNLRFGMKVDPDDARRSKSGRPVALVPCLDDLAVEEKIRGFRAEGITLRAIAEALNGLGIPGKRGVTKRSTGRWSKSSVGAVLKRGGP
jgi:site-specific DNA recombinase